MTARSPEPRMEAERLDRAWEKLRLDIGLALLNTTVKGDAVVVADGLVDAHRPLIEAAIRAASGSPTDAALPRTPYGVVPAGCRLVLASENLLEAFGTRTNEGYAITAEWGDQRPEGWYEPTFTAHFDQPLAASGSPEPVLDVERLAHKAAEIGFTYGALGRDFEYALKNVNDMLAGSEEREP